jgi:hypothetical protein
VMADFKYCQPADNCASCGACCGMYNWTGHNRQMVLELLSMQTDSYLNSGRNELDLVRLRKEINRKRPAPRYQKIYNCEFLGFIDRERKRVGCLLHPALNSGRNLRGISHHGQETCDEAKCTAYFYLSEQEAELVAKAADDWYLYGLCLTDLDLINEFLNIASEMVFTEVKAGKIMAEPRLLEIFSGYLALKERWPFARDPNRFGKYFFRDGDYPIYKIDYKALNSLPCRYDRILNSLGSGFQGQEELVAARETLRKIFNDFVEAWQA